MCVKPTIQALPSSGVTDFLLKLPLKNHKNKNISRYLVGNDDQVDWNVLSNRDLIVAFNVRIKY